MGLQRVRHNWATFTFTFKRNSEMLCSLCSEVNITLENDIEGQPGLFTRCSCGHQVEWAVVLNETFFLSFYVHHTVEVVCFLGLFNVFISHSKRKVINYTSSCAQLSCSVISDFAGPLTVAYQAPLSMWSSQQEYWSRLPFLPPGCIFVTSPTITIHIHCVCVVSWVLGGDFLISS